MKNTLAGFIRYKIITKSIVLSLSFEVLSDDEEDDDERWSFVRFDNEIVEIIKKIRFSSKPEMMYRFGCGFDDRRFDVWNIKEGYKGKKA